MLSESERFSAGAERHATRLSQVKKKLRAYVLEADQMYEHILAEKVATQSLPEAERREQLSVFAAPDCRGWHTNVEGLIEKELGRSQANEFASEAMSYLILTPSPQPSPAGLTLIHIFPASGNFHQVCGSDRPD